MLILMHRIAHALHRARVPVLPKLIYVFNRIVFAVVLPPGVVLGRNVILGYKGLAIVIHHRAVIEDDVNIGPGCVIGGRSHHERVPVIRQGALIGAGAKVIGPVVVGRHARVGANAVVLEDVPDGGVVVGIPARLVRIDPLPDRTP
jgi:serine O-acetyltransferase